MRDYTASSYGRNGEVADICRLFDNDRDVSMPGPRRLGKTFVVDRLKDAAPGKGWRAIKVEVAGCSDTASFFREMCTGIDKALPATSLASMMIRQRFGQVLNPRQDRTGHWSQQLLSVDHQSYFERQLKALHEDPGQRTALLIDELPIFLKALHDKGPDGVQNARNLMNLLSRLRADHPRVRWMITGSIGIEPLARAGNYMGVLAKFVTFELLPLTAGQARDFLQDLVRDGQLMHRREITDSEAEAVIAATGWCVAYYLEALAQKLSGEPCADQVGASQAVEAAVGSLLQPAEMATFGTWEEHLRKHYHDGERVLAFAVLGALAPEAQGLSLSTLLAAVGLPALTRHGLRGLLLRLHADGFLDVDDWEADEPMVRFRNLLLRRWWYRFQPQAAR